MIAEYGASDEMSSTVLSGFKCYHRYTPKDSCRTNFFQELKSFLHKTKAMPQIGIEIASTEPKVFA